MTANDSLKKFILTYVSDPGDNTYICDDSSLGLLLRLGDRFRAKQPREDGYRRYPRRSH